MLVFVQKAVQCMSVSGCDLKGKIPGCAGIEFLYIETNGNSPLGLVLYSNCGDIQLEKLRIDLDKMVFMDIQHLVDAARINPVQQKILEIGAVFIVEYLAQKHKEESLKQKELLMLCAERLKQEKILQEINEKINTLLKNEVAD